MEKVTINIDDSGVQRVFEIKKMNAFQAERWYLRALGLLGGAMGKLEGGDATGAEVLGALGALDFEKAQPLLTELLDCCSLVDGNFSKPINEASARDLVRSPLTLTRLRVESFKVNFGFLLSGDAFASLTKAVTD